MDSLEAEIRALGSTSRETQDELCDVKVGEHMEEREQTSGFHTSQRGVPDRIWYTVPDYEQRMRPVPTEMARRAQEKLQGYYSSLPERRHRVQAGRALGYGPLRILEDQNPRAALVVKIAAGAAALAGLLYIAAQFD